VVPRVQHHLPGSSELGNLFLNLLCAPALFRLADARSILDVAAAIDNSYLEQPFGSAQGLKVEPTRHVNTGLPKTSSSGDDGRERPRRKQPFAQRVLRAGQRLEGSQTVLLTVLDFEFQAAVVWVFLVTQMFKLTAVTHPGVV
jgi:hypothetical protein